MYYVDTNPYPKPYSPGNAMAYTILQMFGERAPRGRSEEGFGVRLNMQTPALPGVHSWSWPFALPPPLGYNCDSAHHQPPSVSVIFRMRGGSRFAHDRTPPHSPGSVQDRDGIRPALQSRWSVVGLCPYRGGQGEQRVQKRHLASAYRRWALQAVHQW